MISSSAESASVQEFALWNALITGIHGEYLLQEDLRQGLVAGAFSSNPQKSRESASQLGVVPERAYDDYRQMAEEESRLPEGERIDFAVIATPNTSHFEMARCLLESGFHVMCEKPMG